MYFTYINSTLHKNIIYLTNKTNYGMFFEQIYLFVYNRVEDQIFISIFKN